MATSFMNSFLPSPTFVQTNGMVIREPNRMRFPLRIVKAVREVWNDKPLFVRISATDWAAGGEHVCRRSLEIWGIEQSSLFAKELVELGIDFLDISSGGILYDEESPPVEGFQAPLAARLKKDYPNFTIGAVGSITSPHYANDFIKEGKADVVSIGRELLRKADWPLWAANELGVAAKPACQYEGSLHHMLS
ncbi:hypothetical protein M422DRAFT_54214 [Sphaerobolus stellatus SS14]|uniref:NADH:flavin oxidoreductase/NADH oxidase N-terminal domain-containing protein n=1 Tax=Sphaerobolus stellatus (strain SS14) TaxID=990650 RepID=A0A0C9UKH5_SPHS4|nr:hypothetical protein M422DRAFT_54214 [Sphaerobolus stellatus SS14]